MEKVHQSGDMIADRYRIVGTLGQGGVGITYAAEDVQTNQQVALKVLTFRHMGDWKTLELFEREAKVLAQLNHPAIPRYLDYFQVDTPTDRGFYIAQQLAEGKSLANLVDTGWRGSEADIKEIAAQILQILIYLHELHPPVIHRDIKPQNLIRRSDGTITLVDFGAVQDTYRHTQVGGSTVVGTYGYMPPEQFRGKALPASDLFSLGATILFLLTGRSPADLPEVRMKINFRDAVNVSPSFADWLERMLEPAAEDRFTSARDALAALHDQTASAIASKPPRMAQPYGSRIKLTIIRDRLDIYIPPAGWRFEFVPLLGFALFWNIFLVVWTVGAASAGGFFALFSIPFWMVGVGMLYPVLMGIAGSTRLTIGKMTFQLHKELFGFKSLKQGRTTDLQKVELGSSMTINDQPVMEIMLRHGVRTLKFGFNLTNIEKEWLQSEITYFLNSL